MILKMLLDETTAGGGGNPQPQYVGYIALAVIAVLAIIFFVVSGRKGKQRQKEYEEELQAITRGTKVKTIGGICGVVVEVCGDNTVVLETGSEDSGKSYIKIDKTCIAQTDLHVHPEQNKPKEEGEAKESEEKAGSAESAQEAPAPTQEGESEETPAQKQSEEAADDPFKTEENS